MKIDTNQTLKALNGEVLKDNDGQGNAVDATLKMAVVNALLAPVQKETGLDKVKKYELATRIYKNDEVELSSEDIVLIKKCVGDNFAPIVVGQIFNILEGKVE